jgi:hypothetical protein
VLYAHNADIASHVLYNTAVARTRDQAGTAVKFAVPAIAHGIVDIGTQTGLTVCGLLS